MTQPTRIQTEGKTVDHALQAAASQLDVLAKELSYEIISETKGGLLGLIGLRKVKVEAWISGSPRRRSRQDKADRPKRNHDNKRQGARHGGNGEPNRPELTTEEKDALVKEISTFCAGICKFIIGYEPKIETTLEDERLAINILDEELGEQMANNGKLAEAFEHLLRKKPRHLKRELPFRIFVDAGDTRKNREQELVKMAKDLSEQVHENQRPIVLNYKNSYDRKVIHMALDQDERVFTKSIGQGSNRKLMIVPSEAESTV